MTTSLPRQDRIRRALELLRNETTDKFADVVPFEADEFTDPVLAQQRTVGPRRLAIEPRALGFGQARPVETPEIHGGIEGLGRDAADRAALRRLPLSELRRPHEEADRMERRL